MGPEKLRRSLPVPAPAAVPGRWVGARVGVAHLNYRRPAVIPGLRTQRWAGLGPILRPKKARTHHLGS